MVGRFLHHSFISSLLLLHIWNAGRWGNPNKEKKKKSLISPEKIRNKNENPITDLVYWSNKNPCNCLGWLSPITSWTFSTVLHILVHSLITVAFWQSVVSDDPYFKLSGSQPISFYFIFTRARMKFYTHMHEAGLNSVMFCCNSWVCPVTVTRLTNL